MSWKPGDHLPYDGWYNGNPYHMVHNGTYADFRPKLESRVEYGLMRQKDLDRWDEEWEKIPVAERIRLRNIVVDDSTPKEVTIVTDSGKTVTARKSRPSENNSTKPVSGRRARAKPAPKGRAPGALVKKNTPVKKPSKS